MYGVAMQHRIGALLAVSLALVVASAAWAWAQDLGDAGICARCHERETALAVSAGGHAEFLDCVACHENRRPGSFGRRHRSIPKSCTSHHGASVEAHPLPQKELRSAKLRRRCLKCHEVHGSTNANLIRTKIRHRRRLRSIDFQAAGGAVEGGFVDPTTPGNGLCEVCHRSTRFYSADGQGESHFADDCSVCHDHAAGFEVMITDASCATCHPDEAAKLAEPSLHQARFEGRCSRCHAEVSAEPGPGHRAISACNDCHSPQRVASHVPPGVAIPCTQCHEPHGSGDNIRLIREVVQTLAGDDSPVLFDNLAGRVDGSFASASDPGTGLCEVCHTTTQFYRADASGAPHYTTSCLVCHKHAAGFEP